MTRCALKIDNHIRFIYETYPLVAHCKWPWKQSHASISFCIPGIRDVIEKSTWLRKMSATESRDPSVSKTKDKLPVHQLNPSYTVRVICCVLFIFLTEIFLAHYIYRLINSEIREEYLTQNSFERNFLDGIRSEKFRDEVKRIIRDYEFNNLSGDNNKSIRVKRNVKHRVDFNYLSVQAEEPQVKVRDVSDDPEGVMKNDEDKGDGGDWIWVTSSSRIPVS